MKTYAFLDIETTGLDPTKNFITEIAVLKVDEDGNELGFYDTLVKLPEGEIVPPFIERLTGITDDMLEEKGVHIDEAIGGMAEFIGDSTVVAQFAPFDFSFVEKYGAFDSFYCTRTMSYQIDPTQSAKLDDIAARYGIKRDIKHRALSDVKTTKAVFFKMREDLANNAESPDDLHNVIGQSFQRKLSYIPVNVREVRNYDEDGYTIIEGDE
jgi:DNA polymerase-3 subunit epsilon